MKLGVMQPYFFPYLGYFQLIRAVDKFILYDSLPYIRHGWVNRNRILQVHQGIRYIGVPLRKPTTGVAIREIRIDGSQPWAQTLLRSLWHNYRRAAAFEEIYPLAETLLAYPYETLSEINFATLKAVTTWLSIGTPIVYGSEKYHAIELSLGETDPHCDKKTRRILALCRAEKADTYLNPPGGQTLYQPAVFQAKGIELQFLHPGDTPYPQTPDANREKAGHPFVCRLSILDVLMHCGLGGTRRLLGDYTLSGRSCMPSSQAER